MTNQIKVFISYSWDSEEHKNWVLNLANRLSSDGVYVILDQYDLFAGKNMTQFMERAVDEADKVLNILTKNYKTKADNRTGGVGYEYSMVTQELFSTQATNIKFIPIRREGTYSESAPKFLGVLVSHDMTNDTTYEKSYSELLKLIFNQPIVVRPALGKVPSFATAIVPLKLIDDTLNLAKCKMKLFGNWRFTITISSSHYDTPEFFKLLKDNFVFDSKDKIFLPHIANDIFKVKHHPVVEYEMALKQYLFGNWYINEKLQILSSKLLYEFSEYSDGDFLLLNISQPFTTIFYLLIALDKIQKSKSVPLNLGIETEFVSNGKSTLYQKYSPFDFGFAMDIYAIPDNHFKTAAVIDKADINTLYDFYQKLYNGFVSNNPRSMNPYVTINKDQFKGLVEQYLK